MESLEHIALPKLDLAGQRVVAAMSGGVDSSVCALLLKRSGARVMGATMRLFGSDDIAGDDDFEEDSTCCSLADVDDARAVCRRLEIDHHTLNFRIDFAEKVMDPFCRSYLQGETPNPCIDCNRYLKFDTLQKFRASREYDYVATGHYVRSAFNSDTGRYELRVAADASKDQSYVLYSLSQDQLAHTLFPLGDLAKTQVRAIAEAAGFENAQKAESQDICFVPDGDYLAFIERHTGEVPQPGDIVDVEGRVLGKHHGLARYTIGQRKGIGIAASEPLYVCGKRLAENELVVGSRADTLITQVEVSDVNFVCVEGFEGAVRAQAKIRYRQDAQPAQVVQTGAATIKIAFDNPVAATAPGQAAVIYDGDRVLAGGTIVSCS